MLNRDVRLKDIVSDECPRHVSNQFGVNIMTVNSLRSKFKYLGVFSSIKQDIHSITCNSVKNVPIQKITSKKLYHDFICQCKESPTASHKWEQIHNVQAEQCIWDSAWGLVRKITNNKDERYFMHRFLHRLIYTKDKLYLFGMVNNDVCEFCNQGDVETLEHAYSSCTYNNDLIYEILNWLNEKCETNINVTLFEYFIGIKYELDNDVIFLYNRILWLAKYFIYLKRKENAIISIAVFKNWIKNYWQHYKLTHNDNSRMYQRNTNTFALIEM